MVDNNYEGDLFVTEIEDEDGVTRRFVETISIPYNGKNYAVLEEVFDEKDADNGVEPLTWIARIEEEGDEVYYESPTDEETDAVIDLYEQILDEEENSEH